MKRLLLSVVVIMSIGGCETSVAWYYNHPGRRIVMVDGLEVSVVPRRANEFDSFGGDEYTSTNTARLRARQIQAIEEVSGCKVTTSDYMPGSWVLQTVVKCSDTHK